MEDDVVQRVGQEGARASGDTARDLFGVVDSLSIVGAASAERREAQDQDGGESGGWFLRQERPVDEVTLRADDSGVFAVERREVCASGAPRLGAAQPHWEGSACLRHGRGGTVVS